jgi:transposase
MDTSASTPLPCRDAIPELTDEQWLRVAPLLPEALLERAPRRGRPSIDTRRVLNSVIWVLHTREPWSALPEGYVPYQTAHRYYLRWKRSGVLMRVVLALFDSDAMLDERRVTRRAASRAN